MSRSVGFLFGNRDFLIMFIGNPKSWPLGSKLISFLMCSNISSRSWILFHVFLHPIGELFFVAKPKTSPFATMWLETRIYVITWLSTVFWPSREPISFGHAIHMNRLLQSGYTLFVENFYICQELLSP